MTGANVCLVDMDTRFGDVAIMMDIAVEVSIADVARNIDHIVRGSVLPIVSHEILSAIAAGNPVKVLDLKVAPSGDLACTPFAS